MDVFKQMISGVQKVFQNEKSDSVNTAASNLCILLAKCQLEEVATQFATSSGLFSAISKLFMKKKPREALEVELLRVIREVLAQVTF